MALTLGCLYFLFTKFKQVCCRIFITFKPKWSGLNSIGEKLDKIVRHHVKTQCSIIALLTKNFKGIVKFSGSVFSQKTTLSDIYLALNSEELVWS